MSQRHYYSAKRRRIRRKKILSLFTIFLLLFLIGGGAFYWGLESGYLFPGSHANAKSLEQQTPKDDTSIADKPDAPADNDTAAIDTDTDIVWDDADTDIGTQAPADDIDASAQTPADDIGTGAQTPADDIDTGAQTPADDIGTGAQTPADDADTEAPIDDANADTEIPEDNGEYSFKNTLFIGDSRTEGLFINTGLTDATFYAVRGLAVDNIYTKQFIAEGKKSGKLTVMDALKLHSYRKIFIMLGVNELGWAYEELFIEQYATVIDDIMALQPDAEIIIQSIIPVTKEKSDNDKIYNNKRIYRYNELIEEMAQDKGAVYADLLPALTNKDGALPQTGSSDGVHLTKSYYQKWLEYLTTQAY